MKAVLSTHENLGLLSGILSGCRLLASDGNVPTLGKDTRPALDIPATEREFRRQAELRPSAGNPVLHWALTYEGAKDDRELRALGTEFLDMLGLVGTQRIIAFRKTKDGEELHLVANAVDENGFLIPNTDLAERTRRAAAVISENR